MLLISCHYLPVTRVGDLRHRQAPVATSVYMRKLDVRQAPFLERDENDDSRQTKGQKTKDKGQAV